MTRLVLTDYAPGSEQAAPGAQEVFGLKGTSEMQLPRN